MLRSYFRLTFFALSTLCVLASASAQAADFSADQVEYSKHQPKATTTSKAYMSTLGVRLENSPGQAGEVVWVSNNREKKVWVLRPAKKLYAEEAFKEGGRKGQAGVNGKDERIDVGTLMDTKACDGFDKSKQFSMETVAGRKTTKWACGDSSTQTTIMQWYDADLKIVVREQDESGQVSELRNVTLAKQPDTLFQLTPGYRKVSMQELFAAGT